MDQDANLLAQLENTTVKKKKKKGVNQKQKGKRGETWFADKLTKVSGLNFERIYTSGASVGKKNSKRLTQLTQAQGESQLGDIISPENLTHYFIWESKNYAELDFHNLLKPPDKFSRQTREWLEELNFDIVSGFTKLKMNVRPLVGFLLIKVTRKGDWIIGNIDYINKMFENIEIENHLVFENEPSKVLQEKGFGNKYFMTDFDSFLSQNSKELFKVDKDREEKLKKAQEAFDKIYKS